MNTKTGGGGRGGNKPDMGEPQLGGGGGSKSDMSEPQERVLILDGVEVL